MHDFFTDDTMAHHQTLTEVHNNDGSTDLTDSGMVVDHISGDDVQFHNGQEVIKFHGHNGETTLLNGREVMHTESNEMGGHDVYHDGHLVYHTAPNGEGGETIMDANMNEIGHTVANGAGGMDYIAMQGNAHEILNYADPLEHVNAYRMDGLDLN